MRQGFVALALAAVALAVSLPVPSAHGKARNQITDFSVADQGSVVEWQFLVCTTRPHRLKFEARYKDLKTGALRLYDGWKSKRQSRGCKRYRLNLPEQKFTAGDEYRTRVTVLLSGRVGFLQSKYRTFTVVQ